MIYYFGFYSKNGNPNNFFERERKMAEKITISKDGSINVPDNPIIPFIEGIYLSFCNFTTIKDAKFVGIQNYIEAFKDSNFLGSFKFTTLFAIVSLVLINVLKTEKMSPYVINC